MLVIDLALCQCDLIALHISPLLVFAVLDSGLVLLNIVGDVFLKAQAEALDGGVWDAKLNVGMDLGYANAHVVQDGRLLTKCDRMTLVSEVWIPREDTQVSPTISIATPDLRAVPTTHTLVESRALPTTLVAYRWNPRESHLQEMCDELGWTLEELVNGSGWTTIASCMG